jgi:hypothetical protein
MVTPNSFIFFKATYVAQQYQVNSFFAFPWEQSSRESITMSRYTYIAYLATVSLEEYISDAWEIVYNKVNCNKQNLCCDIGEY